MHNKHTHEDGTPFTKEEFLQKLKTDKEFNDEFGNKGIDQISELIRLLKETPDSRRMVVNAWNVGELDQMLLPPCHYSFQVYTRELTLEERANWLKNRILKENNSNFETVPSEWMNNDNIPTRAISLMWNQRSVDAPLGLPFNIASYGLLLEIIAKIVNMVPDELIGNLGDTHIYLNQIEGCKEQIGRKYTLQERMDLWEEMPDKDVMDFPIGPLTNTQYHDVLNKIGVPITTRDSYPLPKLRINTEFWLTKTGECGVGELTDDVDSLIEGMEVDDFQIEDYKSHPSIKFPLSN